MSTASYRATHRSETAAYNTAWRLANLERRRASAATYRAAHPEKVRAAVAAWHAAHPEKVRAAVAVYRAAHPEKRREQYHRYRARIRSQLVTPVSFEAIYERDKGRCHICGRRVKKAEASLDHLVPISKGGAHAPWNVALAHLNCNSRRGNRGAAQLMLAPSRKGVN